MTPEHDASLIANSLLAPVDRERVLVDWNGPRITYPRDATVAALFRQIAVSAGDRAALIMPSAAGDLTLTYAQLDQRSTALALQLLTLGVTPGDCVGLFMGRTVETVVAMLGVLKARAAYVPLDPSYPAQRLRFMLDDVAPRVVLTDADSLLHLPSHGGQTLTVAHSPSAEDRTTHESHERSVQELPVGTANDLAYLMYTSGSTGTPKGVAIPQRGIIRLVRGNRFTPLDASTVFLQLAPISFDASTLEIWGPLLNGGTCVLYPGCGVPDFAELGRVILAHRITHLWLTASLFNLIIDERPAILSPVRELLTGGEALSVPHVRRALEQLPDTQLVNGYGPTESTTFACCYRIPRLLAPQLASIPIGQPIANTLVYVLDQQLRPVAAGQSGELYIGGDGLAHGYWKRDALTAERFVADRVSPSAGATDRLYKTGDLVRWLDGGLLEFLGRGDDQVKLRGHRIELGELASVLSSHPRVGGAVAIVREDRPGDRRLVAYVTGTPAPSAGELRDYLEARVPDYMIPSSFVALERIPLTANGKADRAALPRPGSDRPELSHAFVAPRTELESLLASLWTALLELDRVGVHDRFFELGGTSLLAVQFIKRLGAVLGRDIALVALFDAPTIAEISQVLIEDYPDAVKTRFDLEAQRAGDASTKSRPTRARGRRSSSAEIAVVGMAGRFPKAADIHMFWANLEGGVEGSVTITAADLTRLGKDPSVLAQPDYVAATFALEDADCFDAPFFGFSPREAEVMDPQIRLVLEVAHSALEHAGYDPSRYSGRIGVFGGVGRNSYLMNQMVPHPRLRDSLGEYHMLVGNERDFPTTHVSYRLDLTGPSVDVQTACSTSGVAIHLACQSLRSGDSDMALVGGAKVICPNREGYWYVEGGPLAPEGHIRAFSDDAQGMVRGSGAAMLVLKRLEDALADGDTVYGLIKGSALNNDGSNKIGFTAPSIRGQAEVICAALADAGVTPDDISYVETHGTGTKIGDPIEIAALTRAYRTITKRTEYCAIGSVKTNIGHLDAGATAAGVIKTLLAMQHEKLPASLNFRAPNPEIDFAHSPFFVNSSLRDWKRETAPRRAGVSSFGLGGTNAHIILEEAPELTPTSPGRPQQLLVWSAKTPRALEAATQQLGAFLGAHPDLDLADVAHTLQQGRRGHNLRCALAVDSVADAAACLSQRDPRRITTGTEVQTVPQIAFLFPGGGAQYANMARDLYGDEPVFRAEVDRCAELLLPILGLDIRPLMFPAGDVEAASTRMETPSLALPTLFTIEYALARLWMSWGVRPTALIGHSMGEYTAACLAGVMSLEDGLALVSCRGRLFEQLPEGGMLGVPLGEVEARKHLSIDLDLDVAAVNRPDQCVLSGPVAAIEAAQQQLLAAGVETVRIHINVAAHSRLVESILPEFRTFVDTIRLAAPVLPLLSNVSGTWMTAAEATDPQYWVRHLRSTVQFSHGLHTLLAEGERALLEVGPGQTLSTFARQHPARSARTVCVASLRHPREQIADTRFLLNALGKLWTAGVAVDWSAYRAGEQRRRIGLPAYPFERLRYWIDAPAHSEAAQSQTAVAPAIAMPTAAIAVVAPPAAPAAPATPAANRHERLVRELQRIIADLSGLPADTINPHSTFLELGFDSLFLTQANGQFRSVFGIRMTVRQLLEKTPSLDQLAGRLDAELPAAAFRDEPAAEAPVAPNAAPAAPGTLDSIVQALAALQQQVAQLAGGGAAQPLVRSAPAPLPAPVPAAARPAATASKETPDSVPATPDRTSPWQPVQKAAAGAADGLTDRQREHLHSLMRHLQTRMPESKRQAQANRAHMSDPRTVQGFRLLWKDMVFPIVSDRAEGARIWDVDGNEYIDLVNGYGVTFFGHTPDFIIRAVEAQLRKTVAIGPQTPLAGEVCALVCELVGMERAALCNTGSEAVLAAIRMARTVTGRRRLATFSGHYHGIFDEVLVKGVTVRGKKKSLPISPGIRADVVDDVIVMDYGNKSAFDQIREHAHEIALVMVEPVRSRNPNNQPVEFLRELRRVTDELGIPMLMDEMVTGFRSHPGGVQALWGVRADLATYGKVVGGGFPIGVVAGSKKYMDALDGGHWQYGDDSQPEADMTWFAGTFVRHPPALAAAKAVLQRLQQEGPALQAGLAARVKRFADDLNAHFRATGTPMFVEYFSSFFVVKFESYQEYSNLLFYHLHARGIYTYEGRPAFITTEHSDADMKQVGDAFKAAVADLQRVGFLPGRPLQGEDEVLEIAMSDGQQEIWLATRFGDDASMAFNLASTLNLRGALDAAALQTAMDELVARHEALRAVPNLDGLTQRVLPRQRAQVRIVHHDLAGHGAAERDTELATIRRYQVETPFDLERGPLVRAVLVRVAADHHLFILTAHHIVADGWSCGVLLRDLGKLYRAAVSGEPANLPPPMQLSEWVQAEADDRGSEERTTALAYWLEQFKDPAPVLDIPGDRPRPAIKTYRARRQNLDLDAAFTKQVRELATKNGATTFATLLAAFQTFMHRLSGQNDLVVGFSLAGQSNLEGRDLVGHCVNFLPLRLHVAGDTTFSEQIAQARGKVLDAVEHQKFTFGNLIKRLNLRRDPSRVPLMSVAFNLDPSSKGISFADLEVEAGSIPRRFENFDIFWNVVELGDRLQIQCTYNEDLWDGETLARRLLEYQQLLISAMRHPELPVSRLELLPAAERELLVTTWNPPFTAAAPTGTIHDRVRAAAANHPDAIAVRCGEQSLSYAELERRSNQLARQLRVLGVRREDFVGVCTERSIEMVVALLAILKAGGAYVPLDPVNPDDRLSFIAADARVRVLLTQEHLAERVDAHGAAVICLDRDWPTIAAQSEDSLAADAGPHDLAYVIYTSGSTGKPKGVMIEHAHVLRLFDSIQHWYQFDATDVWTMFHSYAFDFSVYEIWGALMFGAKLVVVPYLVSRAPDTFLALLQLEGVTVLSQTPSAFQQLIAADSMEANLRPLALRWVTLGGEAVELSSLRPWIARRGDSAPQIINMYGITETTVHTTFRRITADDVLGHGASMVGLPIPDLQVYIVDQHLAPQPIGVPGEILVGGAGVARGYLNRAELTAERFIDSPFRPGQRLYRSGDVARFVAGRDIEYLGRADHQIKIRGFRIELGEIESVISQHPQLLQIAVIARRADDGNKSLVAYCVPRTQAADNGEEIAGRQEHKQDWQDKWALLYTSGRESLAKAGKGEDAHLNDLAILDQLAAQEDFQQEWLEFQGQTIDRIMRLPLGDVMEIGAGSGQIFLRIAPHARTYYGTDFAELGIQEIERQLASDRYQLPHARAAVREAVDFTGVAPRSLDTVIINSVIQYFPDAPYLLRVLRNAVTALRSGGCMYLGDVQSYAHLYTHHANDQLERSGPGTQLEALRRLTDTRVLNEDELVVDPELFYAFMASEPRVSRVELRHRRGKILNETTRYHYDAYLYIEAEAAPRAPFERWTAAHSVAGVAQRLRAEAPEQLCLTAVPNRRTQREVAAARMIKHPSGPSTVAELGHALSELELGVDPEDLWALSDTLPYEVDVLWSSGVEPSFDVVFRKRSDESQRLAVLPTREPALSGAVDPTRFANSPHLKGLARTLVDELRTFAASKLPDYMVPTQWVLLDGLPLTPNGKLDTRALPDPEQAGTRQADAYVAPAGDTEIAVSAVWCEVVRLDRIGSHDNFFEIGGHSLLAVQVVMKLRELLGVDLALGTIFASPSIASLSAAIDAARYLQGAGKKPAGETEELVI
jgi:amino acid adenylation domain-containing protein